MYNLTPYPITPIGMFFGFLLALLPLAPRKEPKGLAIWMYALWVAITNLQLFVNTIIWHNNVDVVAPVWCDISIRLQVVAPIAVRACTLVLCFQLFEFTRYNKVSFVQNRRSVILHVAFMLGFPLLIMALYVVVQPARFEISEEIGCSPTMVSYVSYILVIGPQLLFSVVAAALIPFSYPALKERNKKNRLMAGASNTAINYKRQMVMVCLDTAFNLPFLVVSLIQDIIPGKRDSANLPYKSWGNVHHGAAGVLPAEVGLSTILLFPASVWSTSTWTVLTVKWDEWVFVAYAVIFFAVFGTKSEMKHFVRDCVRTVWRILRRQKSSEQGMKQVGGSDKSTFVASNSIPSARPAPRRNSFSTYSDDSEDLEGGNLGTPSAQTLKIDTPCEDKSELLRLPPSFDAMLRSVSASIDADSSTATDSIEAKSGVEGHDIV